MSDKKLGDLIKWYEAQTEINLMPMLPVVARVDGRAFSGFTRGMNKPFDLAMSNSMIRTAQNLAKETNAAMTYTQSDEITLVWLSTEPKSQIWFNGRHSKMVSQIAALATLYFYRACLKYLPDYVDKLPSFDARVFQVPDNSEAINVFLWREWDATKNSISMAAQAYYSHQQLYGKNSETKKSMLLEKGIDWNDYPDFFKRGTYIQKRRVLTGFSEEELQNLPPKHAAKQNPDLKIERWEYRSLDMPPLSSVVNKEGVVFDGEEPRTE